MKIYLGKIVNSKGLKGDLKVLADDFESPNLKSGKRVLIDEKSYTVKTSKREKGSFIISFEGYEDINDVEDLKGKSIYIREEDLEELPNGRYYIYKLIGLSCYADGTYIGKLKDIDTSAVNDVYEIEGEKTWRIPGVAEFIKNIDLENQRIDVHVIEGMDEN